MADRRGAVGEELQSSCFTCLAWHLLGHILQCQGGLSVAVDRTGSGGRHTTGAIGMCCVRVRAEGTSVGPWQLWPG